ncbi:heavy-metal-associated domain-containing protein [Chelativorans sp. J32]|uniref:heavy-metal-associated domain-containing protein n=1 Tax=Chelativorans sp. J32 TaxID=935840 RepID=UPI00047F1FF6|nr:heavy-metal-associated domain-containing protein [Chelativorans sp. J32]
MQFHIENMTCGGCVRSVTKAIHSVDPDAKVTADPETRKVEVQSSVTPARIEDVLKEVGYPPRAA